MSSPSDYHVIDLDQSKLEHMREQKQSSPVSQHYQQQSNTSEPDNTMQLRDTGQPLTTISIALNTVNDPNNGQTSDSSVSWTPPSSLLVPSKPDNELDNEMPVLTKMEPVDFNVKGDLITRLKQEHIRPDSKDDTLRDMLMSSLKTAADDSASKALLQLAGQNPDVKNVRPNFHATADGPPDHSFGVSGQIAVVPPQTLGSGTGLSDMKVQLGPDGILRPKKIRHKKRVNGKKICLVCGDKALAHNFNVITCESCKAFFRRNALKSQSLQRCMFQNSCTIDKNTRRFCPSCRLKKCFDIGMKAELILDEEERRLRQEKKAQRFKRQAAISSTATEDGSESQVESSGTSIESPFTPDAATGTVTSSRSASFSPSEVPPQSLSRSSLRPSSLPSIHTLRDPVALSPSPMNQSPLTQSSPYSQGSSSFGVSPALPSSQPSPPSMEHSPFSSLFGQLSASSPSPITSSLSPAPSTVAAHPFPQSLSYPTRSPSAVDSSSGVEPPSQRKLPKDPHQYQKQQTEGSEQQTQDPSFPVGTSPYPLPVQGAKMFKHVSRDQLPTDPFMYWIVSGEERLVLANLTIAYQEVLLTLPERGLHRNTPLSDSYSIHDFLSEIDDGMYNIVQFSKHIPDFRLMRKEDQIAMLKSSAMHTLGMAFCAAYVHERDCWLSLRGDLTHSHLRKLTNDDPYIQMGVEYCRSVKSLVKNDFTIYSLIHCMILFDPRDAKIVDRQLINQTRDKYVIMLKHYLESQYSYLYADEYFVAIQEKMREMCQLALSGNALFKRYSSVFQPLINEMLNSS